MNGRPLVVSTMHGRALIRLVASHKRRHFHEPSVRRRYVLFLDEVPVPIDFGSVVWWAVSTAVVLYPCLDAGV